MPATIQIKRRGSSGASGLSGVTLRSGELAMHEADDILYIGTGDNGSGVATSITAIGGGGYVFPNSASYALLSGGNTFTGALNTFVGISATADITTSAGDISATAGDISAGNAISAGTSLTVGTTISAAGGDFTVSNTDGNTVIVGTLSTSAGNFTVDGSGHVASAGNADFGGTLAAGTNDAFTVSATGAVAGTSFTATTTLSAASGAFTVDSSGNTDVLSLDVNNGNAGITSAGNTTVKGSLYAAYVTNAYTFQVSTTGAVSAPSFTATGAITAGGALSGQSLNVNNVASIDATGNMTLGASAVFTVDATTGNVYALGDAVIDGDISVGGTGGTPVLATDYANDTATFTAVDVVFTGTIHAGGAVYSNSKELATREYVDAVKTGLDVKDSVRAATTANITLSNTTTSVDGVTLANGDRVLVKNQTTAAQNGIYVVNTSGSWSRATDADANAEVTAGLFTFVEEGNTNADSGWVLTTDGTITVGSTALAFAQFSGTGSITDGRALSKTGSTINVDVDDVNDPDDNLNSGTISVNASDELQISTRYVGQESITTLGQITTGVWLGTDIAISAGGTGASDAATARSNLVAAGTADNNVFTGLNTFRNAGGTLFQTAVSTDSIILLGNGGTSGFDVTLTFATLTADRAVTFPDAAGTVILSSAGNPTVCDEINGTAGSGCTIDCGTF